jgi:hypothetical protein
LVKSPQDFGRGLAKGSISLIRGTLHGFFSSASRITSNISRSVALLTLDESSVKDRLRKQQLRKMRKPQSLGDDILAGAVEWGKGAVEGLSGLIIDPLKGAKRSGLRGFVKGVGTGFLGMLTKPTVGAFDFTSRAFEGVYKSVSLVQNATSALGRLRPPRSLEKGNSLEPFNLIKAEAMNIVWDVDELRGQQLDPIELDHEKFLFSMAVAEGKSTLVVTSHILLGVYSKANDPTTIISTSLSILLENLVEITYQKYCLVVTKFCMIEQQEPRLKFHSVPFIDEDEARAACYVLNSKLYELLLNDSLIFNPSKQRNGRTFLLSTLTLFHPNLQRSTAL